MHTIFCTLRIAFFYGKNDKSLLSFCNCLGYTMVAASEYPLSLLSSDPFMEYSSNLDVFLIPWKSLVGNVLLITHPYWLYFTHCPSIRYGNRFGGSLSSMHLLVFAY